MADISSVHNSASATTGGGGGITSSSDKNKVVSSKPIESYNSLTQLAAWGLPAIQTVAVLVARLVDADELLGACFVGNQSDKALRVLVAMPVFCYWIFGSVNLFAGYLVQRRKFPSNGRHCASAASSSAIPLQQQHIQHHTHSHHHHHYHHHAPLHHHTQQQHQQSHQQQQYHQSHPLANPMNKIKGMGTFLFIYCVPMAMLMIAVFYEFANRDIWLNDHPAGASNKAPMWPYMLRAFMELLMGVLASGWALGPRFTTIWKSRFGVRTAQTVKSKSLTSVVKYPQSAYSTASYQTVCPQNSMASISSKIPSHGRKYPPVHVYRKSRTYKSSSQSISLTGNETVL